MNVNDRVIVSAAVTGFGEAHSGTIRDIYEFARETFYEVEFDHLSIDGRRGCVISNPGLLTPMGPSVPEYVAVENICEPIEQIHG